MNEYLVFSVIVVLGFFSFGLKLSRDPGPPGSIMAYHTASSKRNEDTWYEANMYAGRLLMYCSAIILLSSIFADIYIRSLTEVLLVTLGLALICMLIIYLLTEKRMKRLFFRDGKRRPTAF